MAIKVVPTGGLGNRMRAIASGIVIAKHYNLPVQVYWNIRQGLYAEFNNLFKPIQDSSVHILTNKAWLYNIEFRKEYLLRFPILRFVSNKVLFNHDIYKGKKRDIFQILGDTISNDVILVSGCAMCNIENISRFFIPTDEIQDSVEKVVSRFSDNTIGIHIRRTDNKRSIELSPLDTFYHIMDKHIAENPDVNFYIATDDNDVKRKMIDQYSERVITQFDSTERDTLEGMKFAVNDLYCLSRTSKIIGSVYSSYSQIASDLGNIKIEYATI